MKPISLEIAFKAKIVRIGDYFYYQPLENEIKLTEEQTGYEEEQILHTELGLKWRLDRLEAGSLILVASDATEKILIFKGKTGHDEGPNTQNYMCKMLYFNSELAIEVVTMNEDIFNQLDECNKKSPTRSYWLGSTYDYEYPGYVDCGLRYVRSGNVHYSALYFSDGDADTNCYDVRPVVLLKSDLVVVAGSGTEEDPWKLRSNTQGLKQGNRNVNVTLEGLFEKGLTVKCAMKLRTVRMGDYVLYPHKAGSKIMRLACYRGEIILFEEEKSKKKINNSGIITVDPNSILTGGRGTKNNPWRIKT